MNCQHLEVVTIFDSLMRNSSWSCQEASVLNIFEELVVIYTYMLSFAILSFVLLDMAKEKLLLSQRHAVPNGKVIPLC